MSIRFSRSHAAALVALLCAACGGGSDGPQKLHFVDASLENGAVVVDGPGANFTVDILNPGAEEWSVVLEITLVQGSNTSRLYYNNVRYCGATSGAGEGRVQRGGCQQSGSLYPVLSSFDFDKTKPATAHFGLYSLSTNTYYDQVEQAIQLR